MPKRLLIRAVALGALLMLGGCMFADGVAHLVKLSEPAKSGAAAKPASVQPAPSESVVPEPAGSAPPAPQPPPPRDDVKVEELPRKN